MTRHVDRAQSDFVLPGDVGWAGGEAPGTQGLCPSIDPAPLQVFSEMVHKMVPKDSISQILISID